MRLSFFLLVLIFLGCSDTEKIHYQSSHKGWSQDQPIVFSFENSDVKTPKNIYIYIRNTNEYPFSNLYLISSLKAPNGAIEIDTLHYGMAKPDGTWLGKGNYIIENKLWYRQMKLLDHWGTYELHIRPSMRHNEELNPLKLLKGIINVGIGIEEIEN